MLPRDRIPTSPVVFLLFLSVGVLCDIDYNTINEDGSFRFRHTNDDIGGYYHSATGTPDNIVRGRYGSRNPATGRLEETVYTAGPRGFRVKGPKIHRKMDLAQYPYRPSGSPDDPLADPYDDPTYSFRFRTSEQSRSENSDADGRIRGLYSYLDDEGERHSVRYAAGAGTGFQVSNALPDNPVSVDYAAPLYKAHPRARGKMTVQRGPDGAYKLIVAGPDHRRAESRDPDGLVRGTYSFLDDKGVQHTVEYIAGAGIGYRVVRNRVGPGTHVNPSVSDFRLSDTDFRLASDFGGGVSGGLGSGARERLEEPDERGAVDAGGEYVQSSSSRRVRPQSGSGRGETTFSDRDDVNDDADDDANDGDDYGSGGRSKTKRPVGDRRSSAGGGRGRGRGETRFRADGGSRNEIGTSDHEWGSTKIGSRFDNRPLDKALRNKSRGSSDSGKKHSGGGGGDRRGAGEDRGRRPNAPPSSSPFSTDNYDLDDDDGGGSLPPLVTTSRHMLQVDRDRDWVQRHRDSTIIRNVGKWYVGLPPGHSVRAHVQNIDLVPLGGRRVPSPSEALRRDEVIDGGAHSSYESESSSHR